MCGILQAGEKDSAAGNLPAELFSFNNSLATPPTITSFSPTIGHIGTAVQVNGSLFTGATSVTFNGVPATFSVVNDIRINTSVPAGATSGPISVTTTGGTGFSGISFTVDITPPAPPAFTVAVPSSPSNNLAPTISGSAEPGSAVRLYLDGSCGGTPVASTTTGGGGVFSVAVPLPPNVTSTITATATDVAGNVSTCSLPMTYRTDTMLPAPPTLTGTLPLSPSSDNSPLVSGTAEAGAVVKFFLGGSCGGSPVQTTLADPTGNFSAAVTVPSDAIAIVTATATDSAGNQSTCSAQLLYREDSTPPGAPVLTGSSPASPANNNTPHINGTTEPGASLLLFTATACGGAPVAGGTADGGGFFSIDVSVGDNTVTTFYARALDSAGNISPCGVDSFTYVEDSNLPANSICGLKFEDGNGNGLYQPGLGENGMAGWEIVAAGNLGDTLRTFTDVSGLYCFQGLYSSSYRVYETPHAGYVQTAGEPYYVVAMTPTTQAGGVFFGNFRLGKISGRKFHDLNGDGVFDNGEAGLSGWPICLQPGEIPARFSFTHATATLYFSLTSYPSLASSQLDGTIFAGYGAENAGTTAVGNATGFFRSIAGLAVESEVTEYQEGGVSSGTVIAQGASYSTFFDVFPIVRLPGSVLAANGPFQISGSGPSRQLASGLVLRGGPVALYDSSTGQIAGTLDSMVIVIGNPVSAADPLCDTTGANGAYQFAGLLPGKYDVREQARPCWLQTTPDPLPMVVASGSAYNNVDFGNQSGGGRICVRKYYDENHNQVLDPGELPMSGVTFTLSGANPLHTYSAPTDLLGRVCFENLPADSYTLTETVPPGYEVIVPPGGSSFFTITGCEEDSVLWLNAAEFTDSAFRTATVEEWATAVDLMNKRKAVKCKPNAVDFVFNMKFRMGVLTLKFPMVTSGFVRIGKDNPNAPVVSSWTDLKVVVIDFDTIPAPGQIVEFTGRGAKGKPITLTYQWTVPGGGIIDRGSLPARPSYPEDIIKRNVQRLPMPNLHNVGEDLQKLGKFPITVGEQFGVHSVIHFKYSEVLKSLIKQSSAGILFHLDSTHCLDNVKGKPMKKQIKAYPPDAFGGNRLMAEVLALKLNILASEEGRFPSGLADLIYDNSAVDPSPLDMRSVDEICNLADTILMCNTNPLNLNLIPAEYFRVVRKINQAFSGGVMDTISWSCTDLALRGVRTLQLVPFLKANPGAIQPKTRPVLDYAYDEPARFGLMQNYPNPFNPTTMIQFEIQELATVSLKVYNTLGQEVATLVDEEIMDEGTQEVEFDASGLTSGVYFYRITARGLGDPDEGTVGAYFVSAKKMLLVK